MTTTPDEAPAASVPPDRVPPQPDAAPPAPAQAEGEVGGPKGPEPTRFGDWEKNGRCSDF